MGNAAEKRSGKSSSKSARDDSNDELSTSSAGKKKTRASVELDAGQLSQIANNKYSNATTTNSSPTNSSTTTTTTTTTTTSTTSATTPTTTQTSTLGSTTTGQKSPPKPLVKAYRSKPSKIVISPPTPTVATTKSQQQHQQQLQQIQAPVQPQQTRVADAAAAASEGSSATTKQDIDASENNSSSIESPKCIARKVSLTPNTPLLYGKELGEYDNIQVDDLLAELTPEELELLSADVDPDDSKVPPSQRCKDQTQRRPTGPLDKKSLNKYLQQYAITSS